jgi:hypothetical protein
MANAKPLYILDTTEWTWDMVVLDPTNSPVAMWLLSKLANATDAITCEPLKVSLL